MKKVSSRTLYNVTTRGLKAIKTRLIKTLGIKVSFQRAFEDGQRRAATDSVGQTAPGARSCHSYTHGRDAASLSVHTYTAYFM